MKDWQEGGNTRQRPRYGEKGKRMSGCEKEEGIRRQARRHGKEEGRGGEGGRGDTKVDW